MTSVPEGYIKAGPMQRLRIRKCIPVRDSDEPIAVFYESGNVYGLTNLCPHSGYALETGTLKDGILTCAWHQARFDVSSGLCPDGFTDDIDVFDVIVVDDEVWINPNPRPRP